MKLSIVLPIYNEAENLPGLHREIVDTCRDSSGCREPFDWEIIIVDDGSTDRTREICKELSPLRYIRFERNCGQTAALDCAFKAAQGDYIAALDGDGQNDPADIPRMLQYLIDHELDVVSGWRADRKDKPGKKAASKVANFLRQRLVHDGIHDSGCTLKVYRKECFDGLTLISDQHRFIPAILKNRGFAVGEVKVHHRARRHGQSKYSAGRMVKGLQDLVELRREKQLSKGAVSYTRKSVEAYHRKYDSRTYSVAEEFENSVQTGREES